MTSSTSLMKPGIYTALVTPFDREGRIDWDSFEKLLDFQRSSDIDGLVICGTTGESTSLSAQEKLSLVRKAKARLGSSLHLMVGTGGQNTQQSIELSKLAADAGADSVLVVTPPYIKPNISGLLGHYSALSDSLRIPICLYHVPGRTNQKLDVSTIEKICQIENVKILKEASADLSLFSSASQISGLPVFSGDDATFLPSLAVGATGCISVTSNLFPKEMKEIYHFFHSGEVKKALQLHCALFPLFQSLFIESNPCPSKYCMQQLGQISNSHVRLPLAELSEKSKQALNESLDQVKHSLSNIQATRTGGM